MAFRILIKAGQANMKFSMVYNSVEFHYTEIIKTSEDADAVKNEGRTKRGKRNMAGKLASSRKNRRLTPSYPRQYSPVVNFSRSFRFFFISWYLMRFIPLTRINEGFLTVEHRMPSSRSASSNLLPDINYFNQLRTHSVSRMDGINNHE